MDANRFEAGAKKEIRKHGRICRGDKISILSQSPVRTFSLRILLSSLFWNRRDITFVADLADATLLFSDASLDLKTTAVLDAVLDGTIAEFLGNVSSVRTIAPMSVWTESEIYSYAQMHGWHGDREPVESDIARFLDTFTLTRPGTKYAVKHAAEFLSEKITVI